MSATQLKKLIPLGDRVLVKRIVMESKSAGGILLAETNKKLNEGDVIAVGPGLTSRDGKLIPVNVKAGDRVLLPEYGGHAVTLGETKDEYSLYRDEDILGRIELK